MSDRSVSVPMTLSDLERRDARGNIFQTDLVNKARTFDLYIPNSTNISKSGIS